MFRAKTFMTGLLASCLLVSGVLADDSQSKAAHQKKTQKEFLAYLANLAVKLPRQSFCTAFCQKHLFFPSLCEIQEVRSDCETICQGVIPSPCQGIQSMPFVDFASQQLDKFCYFSCNRVSCKNFKLPGSPYWWPGHQIAKGCQLICKGKREKEIQKCIKAEEDSRPLVEELP